MVKNKKREDNVVDFFFFVKSDTRSPCFQKEEEKASNKLIASTCLYAKLRNSKIFSIAKFDFLHRAGTKLSSGCREKTAFFVE